MKKIFIAGLLLFCFCFTIKSKADLGGITNTGHSDIIELGFKDEDKGYKLINQVSNAKIKTAYSEVKRTMFGWSAKSFISEVPVWYVSEVVFSKSNNTQTDLTYKYSLKYNTSTSLTISKTGSVGTKMSGKVRGVSLALEGDFKESKTKSSEESYEEKISFDVYIAPGKKVSLLVRGDAEVSNGVSKYYFLGIPTKKGTWENIKILTEYYELYEEDL